MSTARSTWLSRVERLLAVSSCNFGRTGDCHDNAVTEDFFASLEKESLHRRTWATRKQAADEVASYVEAFYNPVWLHPRSAGWPNINPSQRNDSAYRSGGIPSVPSRFLAVRPASSATLAAEGDPWMSDGIDIVTTVKCKLPLVSIEEEDRSAHIRNVALVRALVEVRKGGGLRAR